MSSSPLSSSSQLTYTDDPHLASVFNVKRLIGRGFSDSQVQSTIERFPLNVIDKGGRPYIKVQYRGEDKEFVRFTDSQPNPESSQL